MSFAPIVLTETGAVSPVGRMLLKQQLPCARV